MRGLSRAAKHATAHALKLAGAKLVHSSDRLDALREAVEAGAVDAELLEMDATGRVLRRIRYEMPAGAKPAESGDTNTDWLDSELWTMAAGVVWLAVAYMICGPLGAVARWIAGVEQ